MITETKEKIKYEKGSRRSYVDSNGNKLPGVTTILGVIAKPQLIDWAWKLGKEGVDYKKVRDDAASVGTICHFMCECYLKEQEADLSTFPKDQVELAKNGFNKFADYWKTAGLKIVETEKQLAHPTLGFGGSLDCICEDKDGKMVILDLKTSKAIYSEYWAQVSAYSNLWNSDVFCVSGYGAIQRHIIVRIGKEKADDIEVVEKNELNEYWKLFQGALMIYNAQKKIKAE